MLPPTIICSAADAWRLDGLTTSKTLFVSSCGACPISGVIHSLKRSVCLGDSRRRCRLRIIRMLALPSLENDHRCQKVRSTVSSMNKAFLFSGHRQLNCQPKFCSSVFGTSGQICVGCSFIYLISIFSANLESNSHRDFFHCSRL